MKSEPSDTWAELLRGELAKKGKLPVGNGWLTFDQLVQVQQIPPGTLRRAIRGLRAENKIEVFDGAECVNGSLCRRVWYRPRGGAA